MRTEGKTHVLKVILPIFKVFRIKDPSLIVKGRVFISLNKLLELVRVSSKGVLQHSMQNNQHRFHLSEGQVVDRDFVHQSFNLNRFSYYH